MIEVKGLRVGVYTVTEVANRASRDYIIPDAATVEIKADETATVQLFNEKPDEPTPEKPTTPGKPVPQTGDDNFIFLWGGLLAAAVIGGVVFAVIRLKKSKGGKNAKAVNAVVLLFCVALAVGSGCKLMQEIAQYKDSAAAYDQLAEAVKTAGDQTRTIGGLRNGGGFGARNGNTGTFGCAPCGGLRRPS